MTEKKRRSYDAKIACWNCDIKYDIPIRRGTNTPEFLARFEPRCKGCGCTSLKMLDEYHAEKKIMKDVILHARLDHMSNIEEEKHACNHDHYA